MLPAVFVPTPAVIAPLSINRLPNKLVRKVPYNIPRNPPFYSFASFFIFSLTPFIDNPFSSRELAIFMISFISSLEIINVVQPDLNIFLWIPASVADTAAINPNGIKMLLAIGLSTFPITYNPVFSNSPKILPKIPSDSTI